ncbi:galactocerebrosidase-like [Haliotis rubra]|uniref:galactocerebrosidase-like n=1 Tax=Haliotis rubra TaxID=36100 RepID=UPI001EE59369|nr:galactocerebrosidase-like [Haliotis rubra]
MTQLMGLYLLMILTFHVVAKICAQLNASYSCALVFGDDGGLGRRFDGIGAISGGGATSKLLVNYPQKQRDEILDYMFKPDFGAALQLLKVEIGGDMQSTEGSEASHMRQPDEENYERGYEWWVMLEAKKRNPDIQLIGLPWGWPGWLGGDTGDVYANPEQTAMYIVKWILGAKSKYGLHIDYIGIWNESRYTTTYIKVLRRMLDQHYLQNTLIVAADNIKDWDQISSQVLADPDLANSIYAIGVHYPETNSSLLALDTGKPLWASEDSSKTLYLRWNLNYVNGFMTGTVMWPAVEAFYEGLPHQGTGLLNASEPWSGYYTVPVDVYLTAHSTQFTRPGWTYLKHGAGVGRFSNGGIYVSLVSPDQKDFTIVIETINKRRTGIPVVAENVTLQLQDSFASITTLNVWYTQLNLDNLTDSYVFEKHPPIQVIDGKINMNLDVNQVYTLTTLTTGGKGSYPPPPSSKPFPLPYMDDFNGYREYEEPYMISPQTGAFEATTVGGDRGKVMRQVTTRRPVSWSTWCPIEQAGVSLAVVGEYYWSETYIQCQVSINLTSPVRAEGVFLAARVDHGGCHADNNTGVFFYFYQENKTYLRKHILTQGNIDSVNIYEWNVIGLFVQGTKVAAFVNGQSLFNETSVPATVKSGFAGLGTASFGEADFDNFMISEPKEGLRRMKELHKKRNI